MIARKGVAANEAVAKPERLRMCDDRTLRAADVRDQRRSIEERCRASKQIDRRIHGRGENDRARFTKLPESSVDYTTDDVRAPRRIHRVTIGIESKDACLARREIAGYRPADEAESQDGERAVIGVHGHRESSWACRQMPMMVQNS